MNFKFVSIQLPSVELILITYSFWINTYVLLKLTILKSKVQKLFGPTRKEVTRVRRRLGTMRLVTIINPLKPELNPICSLLALLGAHHFLHVSRIRVKL